MGIFPFCRVSCQVHILPLKRNTTEAAEGLALHAGSGCGSICSQGWSTLMFAELLTGLAEIACNQQLCCAVQCSLLLSPELFVQCSLDSAQTCLWSLQWWGLWIIHCSHQDLFHFLLAGLNFQYICYLFAFRHLQVAFLSDHHGVFPIPSLENRRKEILFAGRFNHEDLGCLLNWAWNFKV